MIAESAGASPGRPYVAAVLLRRGLVTSDREVWRRFLGLGGAAVAFLIFGFANTVWLLFVSRIAQGASGATTGVKQAVAAGAIPAWRHEAYLDILRDLEDRRRQVQGY